MDYTRLFFIFLCYFFWTLRCGAIWLSLRWPVKRNTAEKYFGMHRKCYAGSRNNKLMAKRWLISGIELSYDVQKRACEMVNHKISGPL